MKRKRIFLLLASGLLLISHNLLSQKYQEPQWEMPLCFEDATGQRDTIWIGYDPSAEVGLWVIDPQFDEGWKWIDTTQFNVYLTYQGFYSSQELHMDSVIKRDISSWTKILDSRVHFTKGQLPVVMKWDENLLNSDQLSAYYRPIPPRPRARIDLFSLTGLYGVIPCQEGGNHAVDVYPEVICSGYIPQNGELLFPCFCWQQDSLVFDNTYGGTRTYLEEYFEHNTLDISIARHDYDFFAEIEESAQLEYSIYPNPTVNYTTIVNKKGSLLTLMLYDSRGALVLSQTNSDNDIILNLESLNRGIYILNIVDGEQAKNYKIIKL
ncbi:MAG: T9SS type A sorting domain-containing protein [Salinivirgaceae bacterium]|nr:T9SS type A sorting domain-containing protein [Salinivirgaceae bacterium]MDD4747971.1 T9SS type A sorting domain-containing protein [Salinivirgaceae bacterium]